MIPVLIVGYLRPENLEKILHTINPDRNIYVFVDHSEINPIKNKQVHETALRYQRSHSLEIHKAECNLGVGKAIPAAISWVFEKEDTVIVLEDDCIPNQFTFDYFDRNTELLDETNMILSARSPFPKEEDFRMPCNGISSYPLTNAWSIQKSNWLDFERSRNSKFPGFHFLEGLKSNPKKILSLCYFFAATIRARNGMLKAWDVEVVFYFLWKKKRCLLPNQSCITILGVDEVASNTKVKNQNSSEVFLVASDYEPSLTWDFSAKFQNELDLQIEQNIYNIRILSLFSPVKSIIAVAKRKIRINQLAE
jgi:hypothetical protein